MRFVSSDGMKLDEVQREGVLDCLVLSRPENNLIDDLDRLSWREKMKLSLLPCDAFALCFEYPSTKWYSTELDDYDCIKNIIFDPILSGNGARGSSLSGLLKSFKDFDASTKDKIRNIQQSNQTHKITALKKRDSNDIAILDGWHRAIAAAMKRDPIPAYLGVTEQFLKSWERPV